MLLTTEFAYNSYVNRTVGMSPFEIVHMYHPRQVVDLILMAYLHTRMSESVASFASHIHYLHKEIRTKVRKAMQSIKLVHICTKYKNLT